MSHTLETPADASSGRTPRSTRSTRSARGGSRSTRPGSATAGRVETPARKKARQRSLVLRGISLVVFLAATFFLLLPIIIIVAAHGVGSCSRTAKTARGTWCARSTATSSRSRPRRPRSSCRRALRV